MNITRFTQFICSFVFFAVIAHGQTPSSGDSKDAPGVVSFDFIAVAWERSFKNLSITTGAKPQKLEIPAFMQSQVYHYSGSNPLAFQLDNPEYAKTHSAYKPADVSVRIPANWEKVLFLVFPKGETSFNIVPVNNDTKDFKFGSVRIMNVTGVEIAIKIKEQVIVLPPAGQQVFVIPKSEGQLEFLYAHKENNEWVPAGSDALPADPAERRTVFITKTASDFFQQIEHVEGSDGNSSSRRLPPHAFQVFSITEKAKKSL